jgi:DNA-binding YbaB/EbfC family protein
MTNIMKMVKQAQQMQAKMAKMEEDLAKEEFEVAAGGGAVIVRMNGRQEVVKLTISEEALKDGDRRCCRK